MSSPGITFFILIIINKIIKTATDNIDAQRIINLSYIYIYQSQFENKSYPINNAISYCIYSYTHGFELNTKYVNESKMTNLIIDVLVIFIFFSLFYITCTDLIIIKKIHAKYIYFNILYIYD